MKPKLIYDGTCPICINYIRLIKKKMSPDDIDFIPSNGNLTDFQYVNKSNQIYQGNTAIDMMSKDFPSILDYMWMLPESYKLSGLKVVYAIGSTVRKAITKGCNCGGKK